MCRVMGRVKQATTVDHIEPHRDDESKFWRAPLQSLCHTCHSAHKQAQERTGVLRGHDAQGRPLDPSHPWNRRRDE